MIRIVTEKIANRIFGVLCGISLRLCILRLNADFVVCAHL